MVSPLWARGANGPSPHRGGLEKAGQDRSCGCAGGCNHPLPIMCAWADLAPILSGFTIGHIGGIMGACPILSQAATRVKPA
jgi:hypothetical protein